MSGSNLSPFGIDNASAQAQNHCGKQEGMLPAKPLAGWMRLGGDTIEPGKDEGGCT